MERILAGTTVKAAAAEFHVTGRTARKWLKRFREEGEAGLRDRNSRPHASPSRTSPEVEQQVEQFRRQRMTGMEIAQQTGLSRATVFRILNRRGLTGYRGWSLPNPRSVTNTPLPAICCIWTSRNSPVLRSPAIV